MRCYKLRIYPDGETLKKINFTMDHSRHVYNFMIEGLRIMRLHPKIDRGAIQHLTVTYQELYPESKQCYFAVLQYNCWRIFRQLKTLRSCKGIGKKVGLMKFKGYDFYNSFTYNSSGYKLLYNQGKYGILKLSKIGDLKIRIHRTIIGKIKNVIVKREGSKWFAILATDYNDIDFNVKNFFEGQREFEKYIGIDFGVMSFIHDSDSKIFKPSKIWEDYENKLAKLNKLLSRKKRGSNKRNKIKLLLSNVHAKIARAREDFIHKVSSYYVNNYDLVCAEKLDIKEMTLKDKGKGKTMRKNILDSCWAKFIMMLKYKLDRKGGLLILVDPKNTSKTCSFCGNINSSLELKDRIYHCSKCNKDIDRDLNAAKNILSRGLNKIHSSERTSRENELDLSPFKDSIKEVSIV